jgi:F-type H+-transporting ATPase subunit a
MFFQLKRSISGIEPEIVFNILGFPVSNTTTLIFLILILFVLFGVFSVRNFRLMPKKFQTIIEMIYEGIVSLINQITGSKILSEKILPLVGALMVYIALSNLITLVVPGLSSFTFNGVNLFKTPTADFNTTFGLALGCILLTHLVSIRDYGFFGHMGKFFQFKEIYLGFRKSPADGGVALVGFFVGLLDVVGEFAKIIALSLRLFGNMYAGEVLLIVIFGGLAYLLPSLWMTMSLLTAVVQALVFSLLVAAYYTLAIKPEGQK